MDFERFECHLSFRWRGADFAMFCLFRCSDVQVPSISCVVLCYIADNEDVLCVKRYLLVLYWDTLF